MTVREFLTQHNLAGYADAFEAQAVGVSDLADVSDDDLRSLMATSSFQDRRRFKTAVASLGPAPQRASAPPASIGSYDLLELLGG